MKINYPNTLDFSEIEPPAEISTDIVIVGSGAGGGIAAEILAQSGLKVLLVEEGPLRTAEDFSLHEKQAYADLYQEVAARQTVDKSIQILQGRCVGGSTSVNWTSSFRTPEQTLDFWHREFAVKDLAREVLDPWFDWVEQRLNISPWNLPPNTNNQLLADGATRLGWAHGVISRNVNGCANLGYCGMGCPINAKQSMLVSCIPSALALGAQLITRARAEQLIQQNGQVSGVWLTSMDKYGQVKKRQATRINARHVILSAGAIGSPAVLLRSGFQQDYPMLGERTFLHPVTATIAKMPFAVNAYQGAPQSIYSDEFLWRDGVSGELGFKIEVPPLHPVIAGSLLKKHGTEHALLMKDFTRYQANLALLRDGFNADSQGGTVSLDSFGYPQLNYSPSPVLWRGLRQAMIACAELQFAAGAESVMPLHLDARQSSNWPECKSEIEKLPAKTLRWQIMSAHVMGGCAMSEVSGRGLCDSRGRVHGQESLSVLDGSLFPTSLGVNPQLSIYAIVAKLTTELALQLGARVPAQLAALAQKSQLQVTI